MIPEWMQKIETGPCACCTISIGKKKGFVQMAISDIFTFFEECLVNDSIAQRKGLLQSLDPRVKLISMVALIFAVAMTRDIRLLAIVYVSDARLCLGKQDRTRFLPQARLGVHPDLCGDHHDPDPL